MNTNLLVARRQRELTQEELADKVGIDRADISRIESQGWVPPKDVQHKLAEVLKVSAETLFGPARRSAHETRA